MISQAKAAAMVTVEKKADLSCFLISRINTAKENDYIYDRFGIDNADDRDLAISIRDKGVQEPLTLSSDHFLLSGHRRLAASRYLGLRTVPVRIVADVVFEDLTAQQRLEVLRLHNQQRDKTPGERIRERLLEIDPATAHSNLLQRRARIIAGPRGVKGNVEIGDAKKRPRITTLDFLNAVKRVIEENRPYWPLAVGGS